MQHSSLGIAFDAQLAKKPWTKGLKIVTASAGGDMQYGTVHNPLGAMTVVWGDDGLRYLGFNEAKSLERTGRFWNNAVFTKNQTQAKRLVAEVISIWNGDGADRLNLAVRGTPFQRAVWDALMYIPTGHAVSYGMVANYIGRSAAVRAVGSAVGANPISLLIPCHRVIQNSGKVENYGWGDTMKQKILQRETLPKGKRF
jgi:AraC family transcriptional regulator of adaptative response/methylated-DNA-[protein]-cysteine methyltransferase